MTNTIYKYDIIRSAKNGVVSVLFRKESTGEDRLLKGTLIGATAKEIKAASATPNVVKLIDVENGGWRSFRMESVKYAGRDGCDPVCFHRG